MKRLIALCLCLCLTLACGAALAQSVVAPGDRYVLIARQETDGSFSYALVGMGDGADAMELFGGSSATNDQRMEAFESFASILQPAITLEGGVDALDISRGEGGELRIGVGGETLVELTGDSAFAVVTGSLAPVTVGDGCTVRIWSANGTREYGATATTGESVRVCPNCGRVDDGSSIHDTLISQFCKEGHTKCMGDPEHYCDPADGGCGHHYECSHSNSHTRCIKCGKLWCYKAHGDHKELACGHRGCEVYGEESAHAKCAACGGYLCDGKDHTLAACGKHHAGASGDHAKAACGMDGHYACDGKDHSAATCGADGHYACDGRDHAKAACGVDGHYACDGRDHAKAACGIDGHYACDGADHSAAACQTLGHTVCDGRDHSAAPCGKHFACEDGYDAARHVLCAFCNHCAATGEHGDGVCNG